jgi:type IV secretion system protein VirB11
MNASVASSYLEHYLGPLEPFLSKPDVTDIYINRPGEIWVETLGGAISRTEVGELDRDMLWRLARQVASRTHQGISRRHPLLAARLPDGSRIQIVAPPATRDEMAVAIRRHVAACVPLSAYERARPASEPKDDVLRALLDRGETSAFLAAAVEARLNVVISGGTSTGKTTLLNSLLDAIPKEERLILIEDTPELQVRHDNCVGLVAVRGGEGEADVSSESLLQASLRMRPTRIILGELRGPEAFTFLRAINTGHPGSLTTVHADSVEGAFDQLAMMALQANLGIDFEDLQRLVRRMVDVVVQVERSDARRGIADLYLRSEDTP